jgi:Helix-turn-helix domain
MADDLPRGDNAANTGGTAEGTLAESGYVTTEVAAAGLGVSPRTVRDYIKAGELHAKPEGEGVERRRLVSVDSLHTLRVSRQASARSPRERRHDTPGGDNAAEIAADLIATVQELQYRLGRAEARAELTERAESTVREERDRLLEENERLRSDLEEVRRPWWRRMFGG